METSAAAEAVAAAQLTLFVAPTSFPSPHPNLEAFLLPPPPLHLATLSTLLPEQAEGADGEKVAGSSGSREDCL